MFYIIIIYNFILKLQIVEILHPSMYSAESPISWKTRILE